MLTDTTSQKFQTTKQAQSVTVGEGILDLSEFIDLSIPSKTISKEIFLKPQQKSNFSGVYLNFEITTSLPSLRKFTENSDTDEDWSQSESPEKLKFIEKEQSTLSQKEIENIHFLISNIFGISIQKISELTSINDNEIKKVIELKKNPKELSTITEVPFSETLYEEDFVIKEKNNESFEQKIEKKEDKMNEEREDEKKEKKESFEKKIEKKKDKMKKEKEFYETECLLDKTKKEKSQDQERDGKIFFNSEKNMNMDFSEKEEIRKIEKKGNDAESENSDEESSVTGDTKIILKNSPKDSVVEEGNAIQTFRNSVVALKDLKFKLQKLEIDEKKKLRGKKKKNTQNKEK